MEIDKNISSEVGVRPNYVCTIRIGGYSVNIFGDFNDYLTHFEDDNTPYVNDIPGWGVSRSEEKLNVSTIYLYSGKKTEFKYIPARKILKITGNQADFTDGQALAYIGFWLTEAERQRESTFILHASSVALNKKGILIVGDGGSGKTTIALNMCNKFNCEFISNDLSVVHHDRNQEKAFLLESSKIVRLRLKTVKLNFPKLLEIFDNQDESVWTTKTAVNAKDLGLITANGSRPLHSAFVVHLDSDPKEQTILKRVRDIETQFALYENISRIIRGSAISVFNKDKNIMGYMPSLDTREFHENRVNLINFLINDLGIWNISGGNLDQICNQIEKINET
jgi:hypothetical protein